MISSDSYNLSAAHLMATPDDDDDVDDDDDDDVFYLFVLAETKNRSRVIYLEEGTYHKRLFRGPSTNDMKKQDGPSLSWPTPHTTPFFLPPRRPLSGPTQP